LAKLILEMGTFRNVGKNLSKWQTKSKNEKIEALNKIKALSRKNKIYFFT